MKYKRNGRVPKKVPDPLLLEDLRAYFLQHVKPEGNNGFWRVHTPLKAFKKLCVRARYEKPPRVGGQFVIANLIIPEGALIYADNIVWLSEFQGYPDGSLRPEYRKMRASKAYVHSMAAKETHDVPLSVASGYDPNFVYRAGKTVQPREAFSLEPKACRSGIHFFLNLYDAFAY